MSLTDVDLHLSCDYDALRDLAFIFDTAGSRTPDPQIQHKLLSIAEHLRTALRLLAEVDELKGKRDG